MRDRNYIKRTLILFSCAVALTLGAMGFAGWTVWSTRRDAREITQRQARLLDLDSRLARAYQSLTNSTRMGAATGQKRWSQRYKQQRDTWGQTLAAAATLAATETEKAKIDAIRQAAEQLLAVERSAWEEIDRGRRIEARTLLGGEAYLQAKAAYAASIDAFMAELRTGIAVRADAQGYAAVQATLFVVGALVLVGIGWILIFIEVRGFERDRDRSVRQLRNNDRMERELDIARNIQLNLLPDRLSDIPGFSIAGWNRAAHHAGGDFFDWFPRSRTRTLFSMADVTGHGVGSAMIAALCRAYIRAVHPMDDDVLATIDRVNGLLVNDLPEGHFATATIGVLDSETSAMQLFSAGHGPIFFFSSHQKTVEAWAADDLPFGIMEERRAEAPREVNFYTGDMLIWLTDGFGEWKNTKGEQFGTERIRQAIVTYHRNNPDEIIRSLYREVQQFAGGTEQEDDLTALVFKKV